MAPLLKELSQLETEPLDIVINVLEQDGNLETLITSQGEVGTALLLPTALPANHNLTNCNCNSCCNCGSDSSSCECCCN